MTSIGNFLYVCNLQVVTSGMSEISSCNKKTNVRTIMHGTVYLDTLTGKWKAEQLLQGECLIHLISFLVGYRLCQ